MADVERLDEKMGRQELRDEQAYQEAVEYIHRLGELGWKPGLERFSALCERLGNPQNRFRSIHVGGTNGKGSTVAMITNILKFAGYRVGSYYSPYVYDIRERVQLDGRVIENDALVRHINAIRPHAEAIGETPLGHPTEFEVKTALAFLYFAEQNVDFAVLEVGLGGRLDATNVINPVVSVITNVGMDHMDRLGGTIAEIAGEKAGIIKENGSVVTAASQPEAMSVIRRTCRERKSALRRVYPRLTAEACFHIREISPDDPENGMPYEWPTDWKDVVTVEGINAVYPDLRSGMSGSFQLANAATAVGAIEVLQDKGVEIPVEAIRAGIESAYLPGRLEVLSTRPTLLIDAAHNLDGARCLAQALKTKFAYRRLILVVGMVSGHSVEDVLGVLAPMAFKVYATSPDNPRAAPAEHIAEIAGEYCKDVEAIVPIRTAVRQALKFACKDDLVCVTGSFYVVCEVPRPEK